MDLLNFHSRINIPEQRMHGIIKITCWLLVLVGQIFVDFVTASWHQSLSGRSCILYSIPEKRMHSQFLILWNDNFLHWSEWMLVRQRTFLDFLKADKERRVPLHLYHFQSRLSRQLDGSTYSLVPIRAGITFQDKLQPFCGCYFDCAFYTLPINMQ